MQIYLYSAAESRFGRKMSLAIRVTQGLGLSGAPRGTKEENDPKIIHTSMKIEENSTIIVRRSVEEWTPLPHPIQPLFPVVLLLFCGTMCSLYHQRFLIRLQYNEH